MRGRYAPLIGGRYAPLRGGRYAPLIGGRYAPLMRGRYAPLMSGRYAPLMRALCLLWARCIRERVCGRLGLLQALRFRPNIERSTPPKG